MTKKHYHHHLPEATGEPTIIEINGEPYPEEIDPELQKATNVAHRYINTALKKKHLLDEQLGKGLPFNEWCLLREEQRGQEVALDKEMSELLDEYEKMVAR